MKDLLDAFLNILIADIRVIRIDRGSSTEGAWRIYLSALLGVFFAYTLVKLFGMNAFEPWPYIVGLLIGLVYGACWHLRDSN